MNDDISFLEYFSQSHRYASKLCSSSGFSCLHHSMITIRKRGFRNPCNLYFYILHLKRSQHSFSLILFYIVILFKEQVHEIPLRHPAPSLTFSSSSFLLRGGTEALEHHAVLGALHPDLLVQDPEKAPGVLSTSSGWQAHLEGDPGYTEEPPERDFSSHLGSRGSVAQAS